MLLIRISISHQRLVLCDANGKELSCYPISSGKAGVGEYFGSLQTPRGRHVIRAKIGNNAPENTVFVARRPTEELWSPALDEHFPGRDWMLTRILWLSGCERGRNRLGNVDTMRRYIYIHGTPDRVVLGIPGSRGCIRMRNADIIELFDQVAPYTPVEISED